MSVTIKHIAEELNLSVPTVSRILSGAENHRAAEATRQRVLETAQRMNYRPNAIARSLRSGRTGTIGFYTDHVYAAQNPFYAAIVHGLQAACSAHQQDLMLYGSFRGRSTAEIYDGLRDRRVDGLILHADSSDSLVERLSGSALPVVAIADPLPSLPSVVCDDEAGMSSLAAHLVALGYTRFLFVRPNKTFSSVERRWKALQRAVCERNCHIEAAYIDLEDATALVGKLAEIKRAGNGKLAVCCWNDITANSLLWSCQRSGWTIPDDVAITGFDGFNLAHMSAHQLTTLVCPWEKVVVSAVKILMKKIKGQCVECETRLPLTLSVGDTA